ncbi:sigma-54-dependent Fis family transcriptional regulator [Cupriavidus basilensis]|uniref:sigma-54-dependent Fis family transcriptional regulator n=1 Tax=Cupriavidus basilensis TaxID=68895 RepID=UPI0028472967|nr:sigma-54-dependent Fis family transcriptional regulator [Cupriavidus basilensis]MDR3380643.1 sigma-54-dependent Fis family transcriptional regulator [Cupriavidus basilensis]
MSSTLASHAAMPDADPERRILIARAHARSTGFGLEATHAADYQSLGTRALHELVDANQMLYKHALPVMETLHAQIANTESMVLLTDSGGVILHSLGDGDFADRARRVALAPGVSWAESSKGTNAIGTALAEARPAVVHADEHFLRANRTLTCSCAPISGPFGQVLGALDVSGDHRGFHKHTMALVRMSAQMIENHLFSTHFTDAALVRFHARPEFVGTLFEGMAAFAADGTFLAANRSGLFQLGLSPDTLNRQSFAALFGMPLGTALKEGADASGQLLTLTLPSRVLVFARMSLFAPPRRAQAARAPKSAATSALAALDTGDARMAAVLQRVDKVRGRDIPILVLGRTGTGKEWLARAIHRDSPRGAAPFVAVNCASIPESLIEAELFGYEDGAFTGARRRGSPGKLVQAHGGTLFLDEIGDMPLAQQVRLMRVLQERAVTPLGGAHAIPVDLRIICATHRDLRAMIAAGTFREDLYYRINALSVTLPALRERTDLPVLVERILTQQLAQAEQGEHGDAHPTRVAADVLAHFQRHPWPGNLRQMVNVLRTAAIMAEGEEEIRAEHLPEDFECEPMFAQDRDAAPAFMPTTPMMPVMPVMPAGTPERLRDREAAMIHQALARHGGNVSLAARELGLSRNTIYRRLKRS